MKVGSLLFAVGMSATLLVSAPAQNAAPDDIYLEAYRLIQEGDNLRETGQSQLARQRYSDAQSNLKRLQSIHPNYSKTAVDFRLEYVENKLKDLPASSGQQPQQPRQEINLNDPKALRARLSQVESENATLQAKLREALAARPAELDPSEFARTSERLAQVEKEKELLRVELEKTRASQPHAAETAMLNQVRGELEATKKQLRDNIAAVASLSQENQRLQTQSTQSAQLASLTNQISNLRARLEVYEARKIPFTQEELALMDASKRGLAPKTDPVPTTSTAAATPVPAANQARELPPGAGLLISEAERAFSQRRYSEAEEKYKQVLRMDEENPVSLANLAAIQLELQKLDDAEVNLKKAFAGAPNDPYVLSLLGMLRFQKGNYTEALDALSRSAQLDPKNSETQNYLGITLAQQGQREAAETALRKAILLNPNYAGAHHNLAVIYATQQPPFVELARFHYNKALSLGQPPNPNLEKQLGK